MRTITVKIGTLSLNKVNHIKGKLALNEFITWREKGHMTRPETGIIDEIRSIGGETVYFICRM